MKKTLSLLLVLAMVLGSFSFAFADEAKVDPAVEAGEFLKKAGVLEGSDSGDLMLDKQLKRQDAVVLLSRLMKAEEEAKKFPVTEEYPTFKDITNNYYKPYLAWAQANKYYEGHNAEKFGYGEFLTAQQYATVLLRALGYEVNDAEAYKAAFETAKKLGIMKDLKVEEKAEITRGQMAQMTFNALGLKMKGSDKTLAEFLGIEMPAPAELKVEKVYTENLKEIVVELSNAKLVDKEKLADANNYKMTGFKFEKATVDGNNVILLLNESLTKGKKYELVVRNIDKAMNGTHKFTAEDNTIPAVEKVEVLGEYGIKVTTSEPVKNPQERSFLLDGKNIAMDLEQYGRVLILTPYYDKAFPENTKTLTIKALEDFAGFKSIEEDFAIEMKKDNVAPKVTDVVVKGNVVEVTFDKDIYADSVEGYSNRNRTGNISYKDGRQTIYTVQYGGEKVDVNKASYKFDREIPRRAEITIEGVTNHSDVKMEKVTTEGRIVTDYSEPALIDSKKVDYVRAENGKSGLTIELYFDKDVSGKLLNPNEKDDAKLKFDPDYHFDIYLNDVVRSRVMEGKASDYIKSVKYGLDKNGKVRKDLVLVEITGLNVNNTNKDYEYVLEIRDFTDVTSLKNRMYRDYVDFNIPKQSPSFKVESVKMTGDNSIETEIAITFNLPVDRVKAENPANYLFKKDTTIKDLEDLEGRVIVERSGYTVTLVIPEFKSTKFDTLEILETLKDAWYGNRLGGQLTFSFTDLKAGVNIKANEVMAKINALPGTITLDNKKEVEEARKAYDDLKDAEKAYVNAETLKKLTDAEATIKQLEKDKEDKEAQAVAVKAINEANIYTMDSAISANAGILGLDLTVYNTLKDKSPVYTALAGKNFTDAAAVKTAFDAAVVAQKAAEEKADNQKAVDTAKTTVEGATFTPVANADVSTEDLAEAAVKTVIDKLTLGEGVTYKITKVSFEAAEAGVKDGSYKFTVELAKGADAAKATATTTELTLVISK